MRKRWNLSVHERQRFDEHDDGHGNEYGAYHELRN
jgi:hypothetical protein